MKTSLYKLSLLVAVGCALTCAPLAGIAQEKKNENAAEKSGGAQGEAKKAPNPNRTLPFRGKVDAVDKGAMTITVGTRVFHVTAETKIQKEGKAGTIADVIVGEPIRGSLRQADDGKLTAVSLSVGPKAVDAEKVGGDKPEQPNKKSAAGSKKTGEKVPE